MTNHRNAPRRRHGAEFKAQVVAACGEPGASVAAVALAFGLNANLVRQWRRGRGFQAVDGALVVPDATPDMQRFVPLTMPASTTADPQAALAGGAIRVEVRRGAVHVNVSWPLSGGAQCAAWLRELLR